MKRNQFCKTLLAGSLLPFVACGEAQKNLPRTDIGFLTSTGEGRKHGHIKLQGVNSNILDIKISGSDTGGNLAIFEQTSLSQGKGTPMHVHHFQDEVFYIIEGEYLFQVGDIKHRLTAGDYIFLPMKIPHAWTQVSETGKTTVTFQPAGKMEDFFITMAALKKTPSKEEIAQIFKDNEMDVVGPPLNI